MATNEINIVIKIDNNVYYEFIEQWVEILESNGTIFTKGKMNSSVFAEIIENTPMEPEMIAHPKELQDLCFGDICKKDAVMISRCWKYFLGKLLTSNISEKVNKFQ